MELCPPIPANSCVQVLYPSDVIIFGNRVFSYITEVGPDPTRLVSLREGRRTQTDAEDGHMGTQRRRPPASWGERPRGTSPAATSTVHLWPLELWGSTGLLFKPLSS